MNKIGIKHPANTKTPLIIGFNFISKWPLTSAKEQLNWLKGTHPLFSLQLCSELFVKNVTEKEAKGWMSMYIGQ